MKKSFFIIALTNIIVINIGFCQCWKSVDLGWYHALAIKDDGTLWAWGNNTAGQVGDGTTINKNVPVQIGIATNWKSISGNAQHSLAIKQNGTLWAWGFNFNGRLGDGTTTNRHIPTQIGTATNWLAVSGDGDYSLAIKQNGTLWAWGFNGDGQLGDGTNVNRSVPTQIGTATNWKSVFGSDHHTIAVRQDGTLWAWGDNFNGQLGDGTTTDRNIPVQIGTATDWLIANAGSMHSIALKQNGTLWAWGDNSNGQLGDGTNINKIVPTQIGIANDWQIIGGGHAHNFAIKQNGTLWAWGNNWYRQLGDGTNIYKNIPTQIGATSNWQTVYPGYAHALAFKQNGTPAVWGLNNSGQLGDGTGVPKFVPTDITTITTQLGFCSPCPATCTTQAVVTKPSGAGNIILSNTTTNFECGKGYDFNPPILTCNPATSSMIIIQIKVLDALGNTPSWAAAFPGTGMLNIPPGTTGSFFVKYVWGTATTRCDSVSYPINITCTPPCLPNCSFTGQLYGYGMPASGRILHCKDTIDVKCNSPYQGGITLSCTNPSSTTLLNTGVIRNAAGQIVTGLPFSNYNFPAAGLYTYTYYKTDPVTNLKCDSCKITFNVSCLCPSPCTIQSTITKPNNGGNVTLAATAIILECDKTYDFNPPVLSCTNPNSGMQVIQTKIFQLPNNVPSWAAGFPGSGNLYIPPFGPVGGGNSTVYIKYVWGTGNTRCDSVTYPITISCPACVMYPPCTMPNVAIYKNGANPVQLNTTNFIATMECNNTYAFSPTLACSFVPGSGIGLTYGKITDANNITPAWASSFNPIYNIVTVPNNVSGTYYLKYKWGNATSNCDSLTCTLIITCPPPPVCTPCNATISNTTKVSLAANNSLGVSQLTQSFTFTGLPASVTEVRAVLTNISLFATDDLGNSNEECLSCISNPHAWGSIVNGNSIAAITPKIYLNGGYVNPPIPVFVLTNKNPREITWTNNGSTFPVNGPIKIDFLLPQASTLKCCTRKADVCVKFVFRDNNCTECIVYKCFNVEIK